MEDNYVFVKCKIVGNGKMCYTLEDIVDLVVVGMEMGIINTSFQCSKMILFQLTILIISNRKLTSKMGG